MCLGRGPQRRTGFARGNGGGGLCLGRGAPTLACHASDDDDDDDEGEPVDVRDHLPTAGRGMQSCVDAGPSLVVSMAGIATSPQSPDRQAYSPGDGPPSSRGERVPEHLGRRPVQLTGLTIGEEPRATTMGRCTSASPDRSVPRRGHVMSGETSPASGEYRFQYSMALHVDRLPPYAAERGHGHVSAMFARVRRA